MIFIILVLWSVATLVSADTYTVRVATDTHVNVIDDKFLSFTIDPKYLFSTSERYRSKECICMASSLTPAYIRIAGPSTGFLSFHNATISIEEADRNVHFHDSFADDLSKEWKQRGSLEVYENRFKRNHERIEVSHRDWRKFIQWAKSTGFDLIFALNNEEKMESGLWDPNTALNILTVAEKAGIGDIFWQLGYECKNQSIEEYLSDLETLRVILETFAAGRAGRWRAVGGDVSGCLQGESKSDFKDYVALSIEMMDALLLNGNSSTQELERMSERDRVKLLRLLSRSSTPLWLAEGGAPRDELAEGGAPRDELARAADWLAGLGHAARNGFSAHFRELGDEMYQPSLSFYMALLFKNLVGSKVLHVDMEPEQAVMFAHCTALRQQAVPGAVTLYGLNMDHEPARFAVKMDRREEGGDILHFILGHDSSGNIQVNGRSMYFEGDLKPVVKRVRPYKTLLINLPARSFGFWVLANTKVNACYDDDDNSTDKDYAGAVTIESAESEKLKIKRSLLDDDFEEYVSLSDADSDFFDDSGNVENVNNKNLLYKINDLNKDLNKVQNLFKDKPKTDKRLKRQTIEDRISETRRKLRRHGLILRGKKIEVESKPKGIFGNIQLLKRNITRRFRNDRHQKDSRLSKNKVSKRNPKTSKKHEIVARAKTVKTTEKPIEFNHGIESKVRQRRSVDKDQVELSAEREVETPKDNTKLWKILRQIHKQLKDLPQENDDYVEEVDSNTISSSEHIKVEKHDSLENDTGFIKSTVENLMRVLSDLNRNLSRLWNGINLLD